MIIILAITAAVVVLLAAFVIWRWTSVARGANKRDEKLIALIDPIGKKIDTGEQVSPQEVAALASRPEIRFLLYAALREMKHRGE